MTFVPVQSALLFVFFLTRSHENLPSSDVFSPDHRHWLWRMQGRSRGLGECLRGTARLWDGWFGVPGVPRKTPSWGGGTTRMGNPPVQKLLTFEALGAWSDPRCQGRGCGCCWDSAAPGPSESISGSAHLLETCVFSRLCSSSK